MNPIRRASEISFDFHYGSYPLDSSSEESVAYPSQPVPPAAVPSRTNSQRRWTWLEPLDRILEDENTVWENPFRGVCHWQAVTDAPAAAADPADQPLRDRDPAYEITLGESDSNNPKAWPVWYRRLVLTFTSFATLVVIMTSTAYASGIPGMMRDFDIENKTILVLGITTYLFGMAVGPLLMAPLGEMYGRRPVYAVSLFAFAVLLIPCAVANNLATVLVSRFFAALVGSVMVSNAPGTLNDIVNTENRALYFAIWTLGVANGPVMGPVLGGIIYQYLNWRWIEWIMVILSFASCAMMASLKETYTPVILRRLSRKAKEADPRHWSAFDETVSLWDRLEVSFKRPLVITFTEPICLFWDIYIAILYAFLYLCVVGYPIVFVQIRGWNPAVGGLPFLGIGLGIVIAIVIEPYLRRLIRLLSLSSSNSKQASVNNNAQKRGSIANTVNTAAGGATPADATTTTTTAPTQPAPPSPEAPVPLIVLGSVLIPIGQLLFAVSAEPPNSAVVPILSGIPFGMGNTLVFVYVTNYLASCYGLHAASALAGNTTLRNLLGGGLPLLAPVMYSSLGALATGLVLMGCEIALVAVPVVFLLYGERMRARSRLITST